jgi:hypothetical protein
LLVEKQQLGRKPVFPPALEAESIQYLLLMEVNMCIMVYEEGSPIS